jgi:hypothetical protein
VLTIFNLRHADVKRAVAEAGQQGFFLAVAGLVYLSCTISDLIFPKTDLCFSCWSGK